MKLNRERGGVTLKDVVTLAVVGGALYFVYSKGYLDGYLPEKYASAVVLEKVFQQTDEENNVKVAQSLKKGGISRLDPSSYPQKVKLLAATEFQAVYNGRAAGKVVLDAGNLVKLVAVKEKEVVVEHAGVQKTIPVNQTDTVERIQAIVQMNGNTAKPPQGYQRIQWNKMNERIK